MGFAAGGELYIPVEEFAAFLAKYTPDTKLGAETAYGWDKITVDIDTLVIPFAVNTNCHPCEQATKPSFLDPAPAAKEQG